MKIYPIEAGNFKLDGGAMFGVVPKTIWSKTNPADNNNLIDIAARCRLRDHPLLDAAGALFGGGGWHLVAGPDHPVAGREPGRTDRDARRFAHEGGLRGLVDEIPQPFRRSVKALQEERVARRIAHRQLGRVEVPTLVQAICQGMTDVVVGQLPGRMDTGGRADRMTLVAPSDSATPVPP